MAKNPEFSLVSIDRGAQARATELAIARLVAITATATTRITKTSINTITIR